MRDVAEAVLSLVAFIVVAAVATAAPAAAGELTTGPCADTGQHAMAPSAAPIPPQTMKLKDAAAATGQLARMMEATHLAGLDDPEVDVGPLTLLAPSDEAFNALPQEVRDKLLAPENRAVLTDLLLYHAIPGLYPTERLLNARVRNYTIQAIDGSPVEIHKRRETGEIDIAGARILRSDVMATDGIIHVIDRVLIPPAVMAALNAPPLPTTEIAAEGDQ